MEGPGVSLPKHPDIDRLADKLDGLLEDRSEISTKITDAEGRLIEKMEEHGLQKYRYRDKEVIYKPGKKHAKVKCVKAEGAENSDETSGTE